ncbi:MAG: glutathione synthase [Pseudomonadota bacterium]
MSISLGVVMDPITTINIKKDSTFAMLLEAQNRGWALFYMEQPDLYVSNGSVHATMHRLRVFDDPQHWHTLDSQVDRRLSKLDVILMRKDPPFNMEYVYTTYMLDLAAAEGTVIVNNPAALRDINEKLYTSWFPQCCPPTLVSRHQYRFLDFLKNHGEIVIKPLDEMGGASIFRIRDSDLNTNVILETMTQRGTRMALAQQFIPQYVHGDKRILIIDGQPIPFALARIPAKGEFRANLAAGGTGKGVELTDRDYWISQQVGPLLRDKGILFAGLDVIGDYLTEINITSPTCIRELQELYQLNISGQIMDAIASRLRARHR